MDYALRVSQRWKRGRTRAYVISSSRSWTSACACVRACVHLNVILVCYRRRVIPRGSICIISQKSDNCLSLTGVRRFGDLRNLRDLCHFGCQNFKRQASLVSCHEYIAKRQINFSMECYFEALLKLKNFLVL